MFDRVTNDGKFLDKYEKEQNEIAKANQTYYSDHSDIDDSELIERKNFE